MERFLRIQRLLGESKHRRLQDAHVTVVGVGAVGSYAAEALARSGVGHLRLVDFDTVSISNINRQLIALESTLGQKKCYVAKERIRDINPACEVEALDLFVHNDTMQEVLAEPIDVLIDAIDSVSSKVALLESAYTRGIRTFSSMGAALRTDPFSIHRTDLMDTHTCPLARQIRQKLRKRGVGKGIEVIFSDEEISFTYTEPGDEERQASGEQLYERGRERRVLGSMATVTGIFGLMLAQTAIDSLTAGDQ